MRTDFVFGGPCTNVFNLSIVEGEFSVTPMVATISSILFPLLNRDTGQSAKRKCKSYVRCLEQVLLLFASLRYSQLILNVTMTWKVWSALGLSVVGHILLTAMWFQLSNQSGLT